VNQIVARRTFARLGYAVDIVGNGEEAVAAVERQVYDVVFLDVRMPVLDGLEAARVLRRRWPGDSCPRLVVCSANAAEEDRQEARAAGFDDVVPKPMTFEALTAALRRCERVRRGTTPVPGP
jgi:CheY-like chemotaxis protein